MRVVRTVVRPVSLLLLLFCVSLFVAGVPAERPVGNTAAAQPPVNAKVGLEVGNLAPEIIGEDIDGKKFKLSDYRGKVVMLDFWGDW